eukprot:GAHX01003070.1.p1 GENE.GAHX01003070.1~~GAHX01003070.1.p1  ORF type:complete len:52 (-),score=2.98 GAHX01003070.1:242-397(-)
MGNIEGSTPSSIRPVIDRTPSLPSPPPPPPPPEVHKCSTLPNNVPNKINDK